MRSLRSKLVLYISLLVAVLMGIAGYIEIRSRSQELSAELLDTSKNFSEISASTVLEQTRRLYYQADKFPELEASVRQVMAHDKALARVQVVDSLFGVVLFDSKEFEDGYYGFKRTPRVFDQSELLKDMRLNSAVVTQKPHLVRVVVPLFQGKEIADPRDVNRAVVFDFSTSLMEKQLQDMRKRYGIQALLFMLFGILLAAAESSAITRPLRTLMEGAKRIGEGDLAHRVKVSSKDELGLLASGFNTMAGSLAQSRDELVRALEQLEKQNVELLQLDKLKDQFLANTSHELRTPINGILGLVTAVLDGADGPVNAKQAKHLRMVKESGERLKNLITNILDLSKLKSGKERFEVAPFRITDLGSQLAALGEGLLQGKPVTMAVELPAELPAVYADHERVMQVLVNLVGNAAKFTAKGHIRVYAQAQQDKMLIAVEDTGPGIPENARGYLFQEFRQVDGSTSRNYEGTGLGLALSKHLVTRMGGTIDFKSEVGKGTTFFFSLPTSEAGVPADLGEITRTGTDSRPATVTATAVSAPGTSTELRAGNVIGGTSTDLARDVDLTRLRGNGELIAVLDDEPANVESLKLLLEQNGYRVLPATKPTELLAWIKQQKVHLVLSDVRMKEITGMELCSRIRSTPETAQLPVFLVTAQAATAKDLHAATQAGANGYVLKPYHPADLLERIFQVIKPKPQIPRGKGERVLVVDDHAAAATGLALQLESFGYRPIVVTKPTEALNTVINEKPDLAVVDVRMGEANGFELCQQIRAHAQVGETPVVLVSGLSSPADRLRAREVGAQEFVAKPMAIEDFMSRVSMHLKQAAVKTANTGEGQKILVVDDVAVNVEALAVQLEHRGYKPLRAQSGAQALELARAEKPHAVISDVMMPGMTGYDLCRELQRDPELGKPPVILLTAQTGSLQDKLLGFDVGAVDYVVKPFETEELMARLARNITRLPAAQSTSNTAITRAVEYQASAESTGGLDIRGAGELVLCVDDNPINLEVLKTNLESVNYRTVLAKDGLEALEVLAKQPVELILLDVMMPRMSGYEFLAKMRENPKYKDIPVVVISAKDRPEDSLVGFKQGVVDYVTKPFVPNLVAAKVAAILALRRAQSALGTISAELNVARMVQQASFPEPILDFPGCAVRGLIQSAESSGGDWYGYFMSPKQDRLTMIAGDVTGHGVGAALVALAVNSIKTTVELVDQMVDTTGAGAQLVNALQGKIPDNVYQGLSKLMKVPHSPGALAGLINEVFCQSRSFLKMTASVLNLEVGTGNLTYTIAGAPKPFVLRKKDAGWNVSALTSPPGRILGSDRQAVFAEQSTILQPGEAIMLYSDGVTEAENKAGQQYGVRRAAQALTAVAQPGKIPDALALRDGVLSDVFKFTADMPLKDDVTFVVVQRLESGK